MSTSKSKGPGSTTADEDLPLYFGDWLKRRCKPLDLTQNGQAERECCSVFVLRKIEAGDRLPFMQRARHLARSLEIPPKIEETFIRVARGELGLSKLLALTAYYLSYLGRVVLETQRVELAENYFIKGVNILQEFGESYDLAVSYMHLGKCYFARTDRHAARHQFRQVIRLGNALNQFQLVYFGLENVARTYVLDGQTGAALEIYLLLSRCPVEHKIILVDFDCLRTELQAALPEGHFDVAMTQLDKTVSLDEAKADVLAYIHEHETE